MKAVMEYLGSILRSFSFFLLLPAVIAFIMGEDASLFLVSFIIALGVSFFLRRIAKELGTAQDKLFTFKSISLTQGFVIAALSFLVLPLFGMVPYIPHFEGPAPKILVDSYFEAVSGITTTGLSVVQDPGSLPVSLLIWRSLSQWVGGIGIVIVFLFIIYKIRSESNVDAKKSGASSIRLFHSLISGTADVDMTTIIRHMLIIYIGLTLFAFIGFLMTGLSFFQAVNLSFTSVSTGGFIPGQQFPDATPVLIFTMVVMFLGAISFIAYDSLFTGGIRKFFQDIELRSLVIVLILLAFVGLIIPLGDTGYLQALFEMTSALTGTGYSASFIPSLPQAIIFLILGGMLMGGSTCSTSGGLKQFRIVILIRAFFWRVKRLTYPTSAIIPFKFRKSPIGQETLLMIHILIAGFMMLIYLGTFLFLVYGYPLLDAIFQLIPPLCTVGLTTISIAALPPGAKIVAIALMLLGRLEIYPLFVLVRVLFRKG